MMCGTGVSISKSTDQEDTWAKVVFITFPPWLITRRGFLPISYGEKELLKHIRVVLINSDFY